jgi:recombinational DNA repair protein RecT
MNLKSLAAVPLLTTTATASRQRPAQARRQVRGDDPDDGTDAKLHHRPTLGDPGSPIAYYAVAHFADSRRPAFLLMSVAQVERHRDRFAQKDRDGNPPKVWVEHFDAMAIKTVIRRLLDKLPTSAELRQQVIEATAAADDAAPMPHLAVVPQMELPEADSELLADTNVIDVATGEITEAAQ